MLFSGLSPEVQLFQHIVSESADNIYVIDSENYNLLYANSLKSRDGAQSAFSVGKCYEVLHGRTEPCEFCSLYSSAAAQPEGAEAYEMNGRTYTTRTQSIDWNGSCLLYTSPVPEHMEVQIFQSFYFPLHLTADDPHCSRRFNSSIGHRQTKKSSLSGTSVIPSRL